MQTRGGDERPRMRPCESPCLLLALAARRPSRDPAAAARLYPRPLRPTDVAALLPEFVLSCSAAHQARPPGRKYLRANREIRSTYAPRAQTHPVITRADQSKPSPSSPPPLPLPTTHHGEEGHPGRPDREADSRRWAGLAITTRWSGIG